MRQIGQNPWWRIGLGVGTLVALAVAGACLTRTRGAGEQRAAGECTPVPSPDPFDPALRVPGVACDVPE